MNRLCKLSLIAILSISVSALHAQDSQTQKKSSSAAGPSYNVTTKSSGPTATPTKSNSSAADKNVTATLAASAKTAPVKTADSKTAGNKTVDNKSAVSKSVSGKPAAAKQLSFGVNLEPALPLGDLKLISGFGFGVNGMVKYSLTDQLALKGSLGYSTFLGKTITDDDGTGQTFSVKAPTLHAVTLHGGASYMLNENFFVQGSIGLAFLNHDGGTAFAYTPGIGYTSGPIELLFKYEGWSANGGTLSFLGLQLGYTF